MAITISPEIMLHGLQKEKQINITTFQLQFCNYTFQLDIKPVLRTGA